MKIAVLGDVHGNFAALRLRLQQLRDRGVQAALFGSVILDFTQSLWGAGKTLHMHFPYRCMPFAGITKIIPGSNQLGLSGHSIAGLGQAFTINLQLVELASIRDLDGCGIGFIGGALNVDGPQVGRRLRGTTNSPHTISG